MAQVVPNRKQIRIKKEFTDLAKNPPDGCFLLYDPTIPIFTVKGFIIGPQATPYEGGLFAFTLTYPDDYPFKPPRVKIETQILHPGIQGGAICMDILRDQWSPALTVKSVLLGLISFLKDPNFEDFTNQEAVEYYHSGRFEQKAEECTLTFAH